MYREWRLGPWELADGPRTGLRISYAGPPRYTKILQAAFPAPVRWYGPYEAYSANFDRVLYVQEGKREALGDFLSFLQETLFFPTTLDECWAMEGHMERDGRTAIGELVYRAKTYAGKPGNVGAAETLGTLLVNRFTRHPVVAGADLILGVPANPPKQPHNLPELLAERLGRALLIPATAGALMKTKPTPELKNLSDPDKLAALEGAYEVTADLSGKTVVLVDDLLYSGSTLGYLGELLRAAGAGRVVGVAATKTMRT